MKRVKARVKEKARAKEKIVTERDLPVRQELQLKRRKYPADSILALVQHALKEETVNSRIPKIRQEPIAYSWREEKCMSCVPAGKV